MKNRNRFIFGDFEITKREILASVSIIAVLLLIGFIISGKISDHLMDKNEKYNKAVKIEEQELFEYGMRTDIGNAFVYGDLEAVDTVTYPEIGGKYMYVRKVEEHYTMHTRQVAHTTTVNGHSHTYYTTEVYWSSLVIRQTVKLRFLISRHLKDLRDLSQKMNMAAKKLRPTRKVINIIIVTVWNLRS